MIITQKPVNYAAQALSFPTHSKGLATLLFSLIILSSATLLIFTMAHTSLAELRLTGNEYQAEKITQACESGTVYGLAWLRLNEPSWETNENGLHTLEIPLPTDNLGHGSDTQIFINITRATVESSYIEIHSQASMMNSGHIPVKCNISQFIRYIIINESDKASNAYAKIITVAGTWHDYE